LVIYYRIVTVIIRKCDGVAMVMETVQIRLTEKQIKVVDVLVRKGVYPNRSEAIRDAVRKLTNGG